jgi:hypothetical protein
MFGRRTLKNIAPCIAKEEKNKIESSITRRRGIK